MENILIISLILISILLLAELIKKNKLLKEANKNFFEKKADYSKLLSQKKSSETILGQVTEKLVPFLDVFKYDPQKASFLGNPIDYVVFEDEEIIFIEVKSGGSRLSEKQRKIKNLVENRKIRWEEIKIKPT